MAEREIVVLSGVRTAIGDYGSALKDVPPSELAAQVIREAVKRAGVDPKQVGAMALGNVIHTEAKDMYISRVAALKAGLPQESTALTVNRLCGSGLQAIVSAAQMITLGDAEIAVGGGAESMSRSGYLMPSLRWGQRMGDGGYVDMMVGALTDPFDTVHMGITAENIATQWQITREAQDAFAVESHRRDADEHAPYHQVDQHLLRPVQRIAKGVAPDDIGEVDRQADEQRAAHDPARQRDEQQLGRLARGAKRRAGAQALAPL